MREVGLTFRKLSKYLLELFTLSLVGFFGRGRREESGRKSSYQIPSFSVAVHIHELFLLLMYRLTRAWCYKSRLNKRTSKSCLVLICIKHLTRDCWRENRIRNKIIRLKWPEGTITGYKALQRSTYPTYTKPLVQSPGLEEKNNT